MTSAQKHLTTLLVASGVVGLCASAAAQDAWEPDMKPGLNVRAEDGGGSSLARAAREGVSVVISEEGEESGGIMTADVETYTVKEGDTLWDICVKFFSDPYVWPRIWSYNTRITNPHWIYPGDSVWLVPPYDAPMAAAATADAPAVIRPRPKAILLRNRGFVDKKTLDESGKVVGSHKQTMLLSQYDEAYVEFDESREIRSGDEFAVFKVIRDVKGVDDDEEDLGKLVEIIGAVRVTSHNKDTGIARVVIDESLEPIERGALVGPVHRRFEFVAPTINEKEMKGSIVAFIDPTVLAASQQVVFVDRGKDHGVKDGNRFFVIEKRDTFRESRDEPDDRDNYPFEVLAELRVVETRPKTSTCLVTATVRELSVGDVVEMVKGY